MKPIKYLLSVLLAGMILAPAAQAAEANAPWGTATIDNVSYEPHKVLYDVATETLDDFVSVLDRVSFLNTIYNADPFASSIVLVLHGDEIGYFAIAEHGKHRELMQRAQSLKLSGPIQFRMCRAAARSRGLEPGDIHGFVDMVPMADAEIVRLQREEGYAYMR